MCISGLALFCGQLEWGRRNTGWGEGAGAGIKQGIDSAASGSALYLASAAAAGFSVRAAAPRAGLGGSSWD